MPDYGRVLWSIITFDYELWPIKIDCGGYRGPLQSITIYYGLLQPRKFFVLFAIDMDETVSKLPATAQSTTIARGIMASYNLSQSYRRLLWSIDAC